MELGDRPWSLVGGLGGAGSLCGPVHEGRIMIVAFAITCGGVGELAIRYLNLRY